MSALMCFAIAFGLYLAYRALGKHDRENEDRERLKNRSVEGYRPEIIHTSKPFPVPLKGQERVLVSYHFQARSTQNISRQEIIEAISPLADEATHLWALQYEKTESAITQASYSDLQGRLLKITSSVASITKVSATVQPGRKANQAPSPLQELYESARTLKELRAFQATNTDPLLDERIEATINQCKDPTRL